MTGNNFGIHLTIDIEQCSKELLTNNKFIYRLLSDLPSKIGMKSISPPFVIEYKDEWASTPGLTGFLIIATSHISIHTFPEEQYVFFDIFSCRKFETKKIIETIKKEFGSDKATVNVLERGHNFKK